MLVKSDRPFDRGAGNQWKYPPWPCFGGGGWDIMPGFGGIFDGVQLDAGGGHRDDECMGGGHSYKWPSADCNGS